MTNREQTISFEVKLPAREVHDDAVTALDDALKRVGTGGVMHAMDPRRINTFANGGPAAWSVGFVPVANDELYVTYGLSESIDPDRAGTPYELSLRVPRYAASGIRWAPFLLRFLARYVVASRRELKLGEYFPFFKPISRVALAPSDAALVPGTTLDSVAFAVDPDLPFVDTPRGRIEVRRVVGVTPEERERMEPWSAAGVLGLIAQQCPHLETDITRSSYTKSPDFVAACEAGSKAEGSRYGYVAVEGVSWARAGQAYVVRLPGGHDATRIRRMIDARLRHRQHLVVHDVDPDQRRAVVFLPGEGLSISEKGDDLVLTLSPDAPLFSELGEEPLEASFEVPQG